MTLAGTLKKLFNVSYKSEEMMNGVCSYNPERPVREFDEVTRRYMDTDETYEFCTGYGKELEGLGVTYKNKEQYGGEGQGDEYWVVWEFNKGDETVFFKFSGWYASYYAGYNGAEFTDVYQVSPRVVEKTVWV